MDTANNPHSLQWTTLSLLKCTYDAWDTEIRKIVSHSCRPCWNLNGCHRWCCQHLAGPPWTAPVRAGASGRSALTYSWSLSLSLSGAHFSLTLVLCGASRNLDVVSDSSLFIPLPFPQMREMSNGALHVCVCVRVCFVLYTLIGLNGPFLNSKNNGNCKGVCSGFSVCIGNKLVSQWNSQIQCKDDIKVILEQGSPLG